MFCCSAAKGCSDVQSEICNYSNNRNGRDLLPFRGLRLRSTEDSGIQHDSCSRPIGDLESCGSSRDTEQMVWNQAVGGLNLLPESPPANEDMMGSTPDPFSSQLSRIPVPPSSNRESRVPRENTEISIGHSGELDPLIVTPRALTSFQNESARRSRVILVEEARISALKENVAERRQRTKELSRQYGEFKDGLMRFCSRVNGTASHNEQASVNEMDEQPQRVTSI